MKNLSYLFVVLLFLSACGTTNSSSSNKSTDFKSSSNYHLVIKNVMLFDSNSKKLHKNKTILINDDTIVAIIDAKQNVKANKIIEGQGKLLVPGFIDTHVHLRQMLNVGRGIAPEYISDSYRNKLSDKCLQFGTTTLVDMGQPEKWMQTTIKWQKNPSPDYPNLFIVGAGMVSNIKNRKVAQHHAVINSKENTIQKIQDYAKLGLNHIKLYRHLNKTEMRLVVSEAKNQYLTINAHVDNNRVTIPEAMEFGVKNFEHFYTLIPSILDYDSHWRKMYDRFNLPKNNFIDNFSASMIFYFQYIKENPELDKKLMDLLKRLGKENISISTTIQPLAAVAGKTDFFSSFNHFPIRKKADLKNYTDVNKKELQTAFDTYMSYIKKANKLGVKLRIGTDNRDAGKSLLSELMVLAKANFSIKDILQIATINGAKAMKIDDQFGSIEVGKKADLVLFDENPFDDYRNFLSKKTIIKSGKVYISKNSQQENVYDLVEKGYELLNTSKIKEGKTLLKTAKEKFPNSKNIYFEKALNNLAHKYLGKGLINDALEIFKLNVEAFPNSKNVFKESTMYSIADQLITAKMTDETIAFLKLNTAVYKNSEKAYRILGDTYLVEGKYDLATTQYKKSAKVNPKVDLFNIVFKNGSKYQPTVLPKNTKELFEYRGDIKKDTAYVFVQGGPMLSLFIKSFNPFKYMPNPESMLRVYPKQAQIFNPNLVNSNPILSKEQSEFEHLQSVEILDKTINYLKAQGKTVFVIAHSYGASISIAYLNTKENKADKLVLMGNDLDEDLRSFEGAKNGKYVRWKNGETPYLRSFYNNVPDDYPKKKQLDNVLDNLTALIKTHNQKRFTELLKDKDLSNIIFVTARFDEANGRTSKKEIAFLKSKKIKVVEIYGDHHSMFTKAFMTNLYYHLTKNENLIATHF